MLKAGAAAVTFSALLPPEEFIPLVRLARPRFFFTTPDKLGPMADLKAAGVIEADISPQGDLEYPDLLDQGRESFKALERSRSDS